MPVLYNGKKLIPAPFVSIRRENVTREDGKSLGGIYQIVLKGNLVAWKGSPDSSGHFWDQSDYPPDEDIAADDRLRAVLRKQEALEALFKDEGKTLEVQPVNGTAPLKCNPRFKGVEFPEGLWFEKCEYQITLEADWVQGISLVEDPADSKVIKASEEWNVELIDEDKQTYRLTHALSATGRRIFDETGSLLAGKEAWENARDYVLNQNVGGNGLGLGLVPERMSASGVLDLNHLQAFNYVRQQSINETAGSFSAQESWVCFDPSGQPPAVHDFNVTTRYSAEDGRTNVTLEGTLTGLEVRNNNTHALVSTKWANAKSKWNGYVFPALFATAQGLASGTTLNNVAVGTQLGMNPVAGTINYHWEYDNRRTPRVPGALRERVAVSNMYPADVFAEIPVLGRPLGPVLQPLGTVTTRRRTINIELAMPAATQDAAAQPPATSDVVNLVLQYKPAAQGYLFVQQDDENFDESSGKYTRTTTYVWEN